MNTLPPILGNEATRERLWRAADEGRSHHCYLFEGPDGVGKHTTAMRLALYMNCDSASRPCGTCTPCRMMIAGSHPDLIVVGPDPEKLTRVISVAQAHDVIRALQLQRHSARRRVVIIDPVDVLNEESANSLLKTLEEPPLGTQFILITGRVASLLPTIRSRAQRVRFGALPVDTLRTWLSARGVDPLLAAGAQGSPGLALRLAAGEAGARDDVRDRLLGAIGQPLHALFAASEALGKKDDGVSSSELAVDILEELLRDAVMVANGRAPLVPANAEVAARWAAAMWPGGLARLSRAIGSARDRLRLNVNGRVVLEALLAAVNLELSQARAA